MHLHSRGFAAFLCFLGIVSIHGVSAEDLEIAPLLEKYCYRCHDEDTEKGDVVLDLYTSTRELIADRKLWLKVLEQLETREMPTKGDLPSEEEYQAMIAFVDQTVNHIDWDALKHPGHVTLPRLTKGEYNRTIRDLVGLDLQPGSRFSEDGEGLSGFNNDRDGLFLSGSQMEKYFEAGERTFQAIAALATAEPIELRYEAEEMFMTEMGTRVSTRDEGEGKESTGYILNRGQMTLYESVEVPHDGFYRFTVRAASSGTSGGILRIDDQIVGDFVISRSPRSVEAEVTAFLTAGSHQMAWNLRGSNRPRPRTVRLKKPGDYPALPEDAPEIITRESIARAPQFSLAPELDEPPLRGLVGTWNRNHVNVQRAYEWLRLHGPKGDPREHERFTTYVEDRMVRVDEAKAQVAAQMNVSLEELDRRFLEGNSDSLADRAKLIEIAKSVMPPPAPASLYIDGLTVRGPVRTAAANDDRLDPLLTLFALPSVSADQLRTALRNFLPLAFRRPITDRDVENYVQTYAVLDGSEHALEQTFAAILISPEFLFRNELAPDPDTARAYPIDPWALASRLSYFLWGTMPDEALFALAEDGTLSDPDVLAAQVDRLLASEKAEAFFQEFPGQWLGYSGLGTTTSPDQERFPEFHADLAAAMKGQSERWFREVFQKDRSLLDLVDTDETFLNADLAQHYGLPKVDGEALQLVSLAGTPGERMRGGILGMGSVLTATSTPVRTSPVLRGVWVNERLLGNPPGEPPADAGELPGNAGTNKGKTLREELSIHRDREDCAGCHDQIDPIGFGLEQFDAIGRYRTQAAGKPIDATGTLPDGTEFNGPLELREWLIAKQREPFIRNLTERVLAYALGRELKVYDTPTIDEITISLLEGDTSAKMLIREIVKSYPFQNQHPDPEF